MIADMAATEVHYVRIQQRGRTVLPMSRCADARCEDGARNTLFSMRGDEEELSSEIYALSTSRSFLFFCVMVRFLASSVGTVSPSACELSSTSMRQS